jgi:GGDEF domain-containing protein
MAPRPVIKVLTASERGDVHVTIARALSLLGDDATSKIELLRADGAAETLNVASLEQPRVVFLDVTIGGGAGVGLVHFLQSVAAGVVVVAIVPEGVDRDVRLVEQAASLGASWVLLGELTGDDVLRAFGRVAPSFAQHTAPPPASPPPADLGEGEDDDEAAPATRRASPLSEARTFAELETSLVAMQSSLPADDPRVALSRELRAAVERCVATERASRATIQDASTSAYSFSYFVDLAGREIDLARRHGRRFALATVDATEGCDTDGLIEVVLSAVRDTDIVARADERELLLLLPETGSKGARTLRRRILDRMQHQVGVHRIPPVRVGIASFPFDGEDLSRLLRIARRRAERWSSWDASSATHRLLRDAITWLSSPHRPGELPPQGVGPLVPIEVPLREGWALFDTMVREATRAGDATVALHAPHDATEPSLGLAQGIRAATMDAIGPTSISGPAPARSDRDRDVLSLMTGLSRLTDFTTFSGLEVVAVLAEHACYGLVGRVESGRLIALHGHDLPIVEALVNGLEQPLFRRGTIIGASPSSAAPISVRSSRTDPTALRR